MKGKFKLNKLVFITLIIGLIISGLTFYQLQQYEKTRVHNEFNAIANSYYILISQVWTSAHKSAHSFQHVLTNELIFEEEDSVTPKEFSLLSDILDWESGGVLAAAWVPLVHSNGKETFEKQVSQSISHSFYIHKQSHDENQIDVVTPTSKNHYPVPLSKLPAFSMAFAKAIETDKSSTIHHLSDADGRAVFSIITPIFSPHSVSADYLTQRALHLGFVIVDIDLSGLLEKALREIPPYGLHIRLSDVQHSKEALIYTHISRLAKPIESIESTLFMEKSFEFVDHQIKFRFDASQVFFKTHASNLPWIVFITCILLSLLITLAVAFVSERRITELHHRKLSAALEQSGQAIFITDINGIIEYINPAFTKITGFTSEESIGGYPNILESREQNPSFHDSMWKNILAGETWRGRIVDKREDGSFYPASLTISPIKAPNGEVTHFVGSNEDLSVQKQLEEQLHQAQKLEAVGTLVGGVAHNFNNLLAGIMGKAYLGKANASSPEEVSEYFSDIESLSHRAADMVKQLLMFSREAQIEMKNIPFTSLLKETAKTARIGVPANINFIMDFTDELLIVHGNATQLQQVLMNLISNARDALSSHEQGRITVTLESSLQNYCSRKRSCKGCTSRVATLMVEDSGAGISSEDLPHIFEPFYSTKETGKGTGLGLSTLYGTIEAHAGCVTVESRVDVGTKFTVCLPTVDIAINETFKEQSIKKAAESLTVLVIDDEEGVRTTLEQLLSSIGYKTLVANDGLQGVNIFKKHQDKISLVITDIIMPTMSGYAAIKSIRKINSEIPVIYITGYDKDSSKNKLGLNKNTKLISKPFRINELSHELHDLLFEGL